MIIGSIVLILSGTTFCLSLLTSAFLFGFGGVLSISLIGIGIYQGFKTYIRALQERPDQKKGEIYVIYYNLDYLELLNYLPLALAPELLL